ncbi:uncharacterized protein LOC132549828 [Ylistrum balloti]|uniref:uncharacterized protein LOC132549828 n=1 Tax=Ylistrum balloti TaxID=509963 RepID=UPI0029058BE6|nr:uncharacterized protein LOC132549828 [Ylistrum balloti]
MLNSSYKVFVITLIGIILGHHQSAAQIGGFPGPQLFQGIQGIQDTQGTLALNGRRFGGNQFDGLQLGGQRGQLGALGTNGIGIDRFGTGGSRFTDGDFGGRFGTGLTAGTTGRTRFPGDTFQGGRGTANAVGGTRFGGNGLRLSGNGIGINGVDGVRAATARARLGVGRLGQTLGGTRLGTAGTGIGINGLGTTGLGTRFTGATTALQGGILDNGMRGDNALSSRRRSLTNRLGSNLGGGAQRTSLLGGLGQDVNNMFVDPVTFQRVRVLNTNDASNIIARRTNNEPASRRRATNRLNLGRTLGRTNEPSRNLRAGAPVRRIPTTNPLRRRIGTNVATSPVGATRGRTDPDEEQNLTPDQRLARRRLEALNNIFQPVPAPLNSLFANAGNMSQINVAFGLPAYPTSSTTSTTSTTTTTTPSPIAGNWREFLNSRQQPVRTFNGNLGRSLTPFGSRFRGSQPGTFGNTGIGQNVMSTTAARNIMQNVLGRNGAQQSMTGLPTSVPAGDLNSIIASTAQRFTAPNGNINSNQHGTNQLSTPFRTSVNQQIINSQLPQTRLQTEVNQLTSNDQMPVTQIPAEWFRPGTTNFQIQDPPSSVSDRTEVMNNFMNQFNNQQQIPQDSSNTAVTFPLINRIVQQGINSQMRGDNVNLPSFQSTNEPSPQFSTSLQVIPPSQTFEGTSAPVDISQLPNVEQIFPAGQQRRNFVSITSNIPFSSSISQAHPNGGMVTILPNIQQTVDTGGNIPFISQSNTPETFIQDSGFPVSEGTVTVHNIPDTVWIPGNSNTATDGFSLNQVDLSQFTTNLENLGGGTGLDAQTAVFLPAATLQSSAASLAAQEAARAAAAQQRIAILNARRNQAAINIATAESQAARNAAVASQTARDVAISQAARDAAVSQAARNAAASQAARDVAISQAARNAAASQAARNAAVASQAARDVAISQAARNAAASQAARNAAVASQAARDVAISQAARNAAVASQTARDAAVSQAARTAAVASQAARDAAAAQAAIAASRTATAAQGTLAQDLRTLSTDQFSSAFADSLSGMQPSGRRGPIFAIVPLTSRANIDDMRKFVRELSASITMASNEPTIADNAMQAGVLPATFQQETATAVAMDGSVSGNSLPPVTPVQVINTISAESDIPGEGPVTIMSDQPFAVPIPIRDPTASQAIPIPVSV